MDLSYAVRDRLKAVSTAMPTTAPLMIDSRKNASAASAGRILVTRLFKRGAAGVVTDDTPDIAALPSGAYHAVSSAPTKLMRARALNIKQRIGCGDVSVYLGDVLVGDNEDVVFFPAVIAEEVANEAFKQTVFEDLGKEHGKAGRGMFGPYLPGDQATAEFAPGRQTACQR